MNNNELYHHGILGMKWGIRRTPQQLGYKTSSKKRRTKSVREQKAEAREAIKKAKLKAKTDLKLAEIQRKNQEKMEQNAEQQSKLDAKTREFQAKEQSKLEKQQKKRSLAKRFVQSAFNDVIKPAAITAGKDLATAYLKKLGTEKLGLKKQLSEYDKIAAEAKKLKDLKIIADNTDYLNKRTNKMKKDAIFEETERKKAAEETANRQAKDKANRQNPYKNQVHFNERFTDEYGNNTTSNYNTSSDTYSNVYRNQNDLSKVKSNSNSWDYNAESYGKVWDSKYNQYVYEVPFTDLPNEYSYYGERFVRRLLGG